MENIIEIRGLEKSYKKIKAIDNLDLNVKKGRVLGLLGPNGSGKSTTINCLLALIKKDKGSIKVYGKEMTPESYDIKEKIGAVFQDVGVYDELNVYENIDYFCGLYIKDKEQRKKTYQRNYRLSSFKWFSKFQTKGTIRWFTKKAQYSLWYSPQTRNNNFWWANSSCGSSI